MSQNLRKLQKEEEKTSHSLAIFFIIFSLVALDTTFAEDAGKEKRTRLWIMWGISFTLLGFFIISPEQDAIEAKLS